MSFLEQGIKFIENIIEKKKEGYRGILGENTTINDLNRTDTDFTNAASLKNNLSQGIDDYNAKYNTLQTKTNDYLGNTSQYGSNKNYNMFINKPMDYREINETKISCIANGASNSALAGLTDASTRGFDEAYPDNFSNTASGTNEAINACKLWAADTQNSSSSSTNPATTYFAITKDNQNKFKCYTGNALSGTRNNYIVKRVAYSVASSNDANRGGLFMDGTAGVYKHQTNSSSDNSLSNTNNITTPFAAPLTGYTSCDKMVGGALNIDSINATLGANCTNISNPPVNVRYVYINATKDSSITDGYIQISQLAVFAFNNGVGQNVATRTINPNAKASCGNGENYTNPYTYGYANNASGGNPDTPIDGVLQARNYPSGYHSRGPGPNEWWSLDLGKEYPVYKIDYYNREGCCPWRAIGMTIQLKDANNNLITIKNPTTGASTNNLLLNSNSHQSFVITK